MKTRAGTRSTPAYEAWMDAERKAAEAKRLVRESRVRIARRKKGHSVAQPDVAARATELEREAESLFEQAMREMDSAVDAALERTHSRLH